MLKSISLKRFLVLVIILSFALLVGCAKPPAKEMESAGKAVEEAKQKEADLYAEDAFKKAGESLKKAKDFVAVKKYKEAKTAAEETTKLAQEAISLVEPNKTKMKADVEQMIHDIQATMDELKSLVVKAIRKKSRINREEIQDMIGKWEVDMVNIKEQLLAGKIHYAYDQLIAMKEQVKSQKEGIAAALEPKTADKK